MRTIIILKEVLRKIREDLESDLIITSSPLHFMIYSDDEFAPIATKLRELIAGTYSFPVIYVDEEGAKNEIYRICGNKKPAEVSDDFVDSMEGMIRLMMDSYFSKDEVLASLDALKNRFTK